MGKQYGILLEWDSVIDFDPFPQIPLGALWLGEMFLCSGTLNAFAKAGVNEVVVVNDLGLIYLNEAVSSYDDERMSFTYFCDLDNQGLLSVLNSVVDNYIAGSTKLPVLVAPGNILGECDFSDLVTKQMRSRRGPHKSLVTVLTVPGKNETGLTSLPGYRPLPIMAIEHGALKRIKVSKKSNILEALEVLDKEGLVSYSPFDGFIYEVNDENDYLTIIPTAKD